MWHSEYTLQLRRFLKSPLSHSSASSWKVSWDGGCGTLLVQSCFFLLVTLVSDPVVGGLLVSWSQKDAYVLTPRVCECVKLPGKGELKLLSTKPSSREIILNNLGEPSVSGTGGRRGRTGKIRDWEWLDQALLAFLMAKGSGTRDTDGLYQQEKTRKQILPWNIQEEPCLAAALSQLRDAHFSQATSGTVRWQGHVVLSHEVPDGLLQQE